MNLPHNNSNNNYVHYFHQYYFGTLHTGPLPTTRVAMHLVRAFREVEIDINGDGSSDVSYSMPLRTRFSGVDTYAPGSWNYTNTGPAPQLGVSPFDISNSLPRTSEGDNELIWGDFITTPSIDISATGSGTGAMLFYQISYYSLWCSIENMPEGNIIEDTLTYWIRYYITDNTCCTCDTLVKREIIIPHPENNGTKPPPPADIVMDDLTHGTLTLYNPESSSGTGIDMVVFKPLEGVQIVTMKNINTGKEATIKDNEATFKFDSPFILDSLVMWALEFKNPKADYMFDNSVTVNFEKKIDGFPKATWPEFFNAVAQVPYDGPGDKLTRIELPAGRIFKTITFKLENMNIYKEGIASFKLHTDDDDIIFEAVGRPIKTDSSIVMSMVKYKGVVYTLNDDDRSRRFMHDSIPMDWIISPTDDNEPIVLTYSYPKDKQDDLFNISFAVYNEEGFKLSGGSVEIPITSVEDEGDNDDIRLMRLFNCYPNPSDNNITFQFEAERYFSNVTLTLTNELGVEVARIVDNQAFAAGRHIVVFGTEGLTSGTYYYTLKADGFSKTKVLNIIK